MCKNIIYKLPTPGYTRKTNYNVKKYDNHSLMLMIILFLSIFISVLCNICMLVSGVKNGSNKLVGLWCNGPLCAKKSRATF